MSARSAWTLALVVGSAVLLLAAGCGSDGDAEAAAPGPAGSSAYLDCLREHGIANLPSGRPRAFPSGRPTAFPSGRPTAFPSGRMGGGFRPEGVDDATWQKAQEACGSLRPTGGPGANGRGPSAGNRQAGAAYRNCLADHDVDLSANPSTADPKVAQAMQACAVLRPTATATP
ncbi:hypothetical protein Ais01nite_13920 [Asanoa ishikariensis]|uniref:PT repeat-containing protein n=1 Tax=Asanoa ishikariensis TaxID=137265 RepID=A0A1H3UJC4_9ACTN|nr:hypothetical protein [Asanoa ishikariensis]GIF63357.1 hypothetical protein Ais01nite_13920 [Asanoa ishikariensis]SDZ62504.1 hypothetical protein SAMN05421684_7481 [Asanoa ishikariensis]